MTKGINNNTSSRDNDKLLTIRLLETPAGQEVLAAFFKELFATGDWDIFRAGDRAKKLAEENGTLVPFEITLVVDFIIRVLGPAAIKYLLSPKKK